MSLCKIICFITAHRGGGGGGGGGTTCQKSGLMMSQEDFTHTMNQRRLSCFVESVCVILTAACRVSVYADDAEFYIGYHLVVGTISRRRG